jgi:uncharacterized protein (TIGR02231 family)
VAVTVYTDRARVTRRGTVHLAAGTHTIALTPLPTTLDEDSVRAGGRGAHVRILSVEVTTQFVPRPPEPDQSELRAQIEALQETDKTLQDEDAADDTRLAYLQGLRDSSAGNLAKAFARGQASLDSIQTLAQYLAQETAGVLTGKRDRAKQRRDLARDLEALTARLKQGSKGNPQQRREIQVTLEATAETELELEISYMVRGAAWEPLYDVRLVDTTVTVTYLAGVRQQSGEDWPAVELALSTARPATSATIPELGPWYVDVYRPLPPPPPRMAMPAGMTMQAASGGGAARDEARAQTTELGAPPPPPPPAEIAQAAIENSGAALTYRVARPVAVPSDGSPHKTTITVLDLGANLDYVTLPKLAEEAYLRATIKNTSPFTFLAGAANIFQGNDFVAATRLELVVPNEEFEVQLGTDDRIKVKRELTERATSKALLGNTRRTVYSYTITLTNNLDRPARVTIFDQVPVARHEEIKIKLQEANPTPTEQTDLNILKWVLTVAPQTKQVIAYTFSLEHPRNLTLKGIGI